MNINGHVLEFYVSKFNYSLDNSQTDVNFIPPLMRRRLSSVDKSAVSVMNKNFDDSVQYIVFSSQYGESERLHKLIEQYSNEKEVSPNIFSGSVHNYPIGLFLLNKKKSIPYNALASGECSISYGIMSAVVSKYDKVLYCYSDIKNENPISLCINISKNEISGEKYRIILQQVSHTPDSIHDYIKLFSGDISKISTPLFVIERCV